MVLPDCMVASEIVGDACAAGLPGYGGMRSMGVAWSIPCIRGGTYSKGKYTCPHCSSGIPLLAGYLGPVKGAAPGRDEWAGHWSSANGFTGHAVLVWPSLRQCWQRGTALALPVKALL